MDKFSFCFFVKRERWILSSQTAFENANFSLLPLFLALLPEESLRMGLTRAWKQARALRERKWGGDSAFSFLKKKSSF